jgi:hypothetical protein
MVVSKQVCEATHRPGGLAARRTLDGIASIEGNCASREAHRSYELSRRRCQRTRSDQIALPTYKVDCFDSTDASQIS